MTIRELCENSKHCADCAFESACDYLNCTTPNNLEDHLINDAVTRSIIETGKTLQEGNNIVKFNPFNDI